MMMGVTTTIFLETTTTKTDTNLKSSSSAAPTPPSSAQVPLLLVPSLTMSEGYRNTHQHPHQAAGIFSSFPNGFDRSSAGLLPHHHHQIRSDNKHLPQHQVSEPVVGLDPNDVSVPAGTTGLNVYQAETLSEMFNFGHGAGSATELLGQQMMQPGLRNPRMPGTIGSEWYGSTRSHGNREDDHLGGHGHHQQQISTISAAAMQLFLTDPSSSTGRSPSPPATQPLHHLYHLHPPPPPSQHGHTSGSTSTLHMLLPSQPPGFHAMDSKFMSTVPHGFTWAAAHQHGGSAATGADIGGFVEGQGLSLSLSPLQRLEANKAADGALELRNTNSERGDNTMLFYGGTGGDGGGGASSSSSNLGGHFKSDFGSPAGHGTYYHPHQHAMEQMGGHHQYPVHLGYGSSIGAVNVLRNSKYAKPAQELLEEFCSVGRGQLNKCKSGKTNPRSGEAAASTSGGGESAAASSPTTKEAPPPSAGERMEHQRRKVKLLSMLDQVDRSYNHYCEQMQMVVNAFDVVMGFGAALPYTSLAQKAMSRHFRSLKDAIQAQLKRSCELLGEKDVSGTAGLSKGETPRLKLLEHSLRQQRAFHQMGMMDPEAWRPQRGLPERSVNILRSWLFEHFLHPYPNDADKHLLARQTGLSRNQVSNWFINARVRLWKPMVEEMYQEEAKDDDEHDGQLQPDPDHEDHDKGRGPHDHHHQQLHRTVTSSSTTSTSGDDPFTQPPAARTSPSTLPPPADHDANNNNIAASAAAGLPSSASPSAAPSNSVVAAAPPKTAPENDPSLLAMNRQYYSISETQLPLIMTRPHLTYCHQPIVGPPPAQPGHHHHHHPLVDNNSTIFATDMHQLHQYHPHRWKPSTAGTSELATGTADRRHYVHFGTSSSDSSALAMPSSSNTAAGRGGVDIGVTGSTAAGMITTQPGTNSAAGDVSLTLGLRHAANAPDKSSLSLLRDFGR